MIQGRGPAAVVIVAGTAWIFSGLYVFGVPVETLMGAVFITIGLVLVIIGLAKFGFQRRRR